MELISTEAQLQQRGTIKMQLKGGNYISACVGKHVTHRPLSRTVSELDVSLYVCAIPPTLYNGRKLAAALSYKGYQRLWRRSWRKRR